MPAVPVSPPRVTQHKVPEHLKTSVVLLARLFQAGVFRQVPERFWVPRRPGATIVDAVVYLVAFFSAAPSLWGLRGFYDANSEWRGVLGGTAGQAKLISPSALSRFLSDVGTMGLPEFGSWLLRAGSGCLALLRSPHVQTLDGRGDLWHVLDFDPTRTAVRRRALLEDDAYPAGVRRSERLCAPGHFGRKRGDVGWSEHVLQHHGTALVLQTTVGAGNGSAHSQLQAALLAATDLAVALDHPVARMLVRADGEFGQMSFIADARRAGVALLTRCSRYAFVLSDPELRRRLAEGCWERVKDSGSGPRRYAMNLGEVLLVHEEGSTEAPVQVRLVASRFLETSDRGVGHPIDGERLELFMCIGLNEDAWSPGDVVATYYGRIAQENRFAQADRETKAHAYSNSVGGEHLAGLAAGLVWNLRIVEGAGLEPLGSLPPPESAARTPDYVTLKPMLSPDPAPATPTVPSPEEAEPAPDNVTLKPPLPPDPSPIAPAIPPPEPSPLEHATIDATLASLDIGGRAARKGLIWDPAGRTVTDGNETFANPRLEPHHGRFRLRFSNRDGKRVSVSLAADEGRRLQELWKQGPRPIRNRPVAPTTRRRQPAKLTVLPETPPTLPALVVTHPSFLPAAARRMLAAHNREHQVIVTITVHAHSRVSKHPLIEPEINRRRHQRYSRAERIACRQRPAWIELAVRLSAPTASRIPAFEIG